MDDSGHEFMYSSQNCIIEGTVRIIKSYLDAKIKLFYILTRVVWIFPR